MFYLNKFLTEIFLKLSINLNSQIGNAQWLNKLEEQEDEKGTIFKSTKFIFKIKHNQFKL